MENLNGHEVLLGVTGGIAAYKAAILTSRLVQAGAGVTVIMTESAVRLVTPKTFEALTNRPVRISLWTAPETHPHIDLSRRAELLCIAPATANIMAKTACGIADDLLSTVYLAFDGPILMAPAMNSVMWQKSAIARNFQQLQADGVQMIGPNSGHLSCGQSGKGRMAEPEEIYEAIAVALKVIH